MLGTRRESVLHCRAEEVSSPANSMTNREEIKEKKNIN